MLYDVQQRIVDRADDKAIFAMDVGCGKTITAIYHYLKWRLTDDSKLIIFTPKAKVIEGGWTREIRRVEQAENVTIPHDVRTTDSIKNLTLDEVTRCCFILDECHTYKSSDSTRGAAFVALMEQSNQSVALLSATPASNGWSDCVNYFAAFGHNEIVERGSRNKKLRYREKYVTYRMEQARVKGGGIRKYQVVDHYNHIDELELAFATFTHTMSADEIGELPPRTFQEIGFDKTSAYRNIVTHRVLNRDGVIELLDTPGAYCHALQRESNIEDKLEYLEVILDSTKSNVAIFYKYTEHMEKIMDLCHKLGKDVYIINGSRKEIPSTDVKNAVVIVQYQAGGAAIELAMCTVNVLFSPTYSYQDHIQALGRSYGGYRQDKHVHVYKFVCDGIEREIVDALNEKKDFSEKIFFERPKEV